MKTCRDFLKRTHCDSMRLRAVVVLSVVFLAGMATTTAAARPAEPVSDGALVRDLANRMNATRISAGLGGLRYSPGLAAAATARAEALARQGWAARPLSGTALRSKLRSSYGVGASSWSVREAVLWADQSMCAAAALQLWLQRARDRKTVLGTVWQDAGVAAVRLPAEAADERGTVFFVIEVGTRTA